MQESFLLLYSTGVTIAHLYKTFFFTASFHSLKYFSLIWYRSINLTDEMVDDTRLKKNISLACLKNVFFNRNSTEGTNSENSRLVFAYACFVYYLCRD